MQHESNVTPTTGRIGKAGVFLLVLAGLLVGALVWHSLAADPSGKPTELPPYWGIGVVPFVLILGAIAVLPLVGVTAHWWESNRNRLIVSLICAALTVVYGFLAMGGGGVVHLLEHAIVGEYIPFIMLLLALYVISGGIRLTGDLRATPLTNTTMLATGALIASVIGTTGASMLLIRPLLQTNRERKRTLHTVIFFIFLVSNVGGSLLPIGDPPLFLGYLRGVPFLWTLNLWMEWAVCCGVLLGLYYIWDRHAWKHEEVSSLQRDLLQREPLRVRGLVNVPLLLGVVAAVAILVPGKVVLQVVPVFPFMRELVMMALIGLSLWLTPAGLRDSNRFNYHAILEVAALFVGIFIAMQIPVMVLNLKGDDFFHLTHPWQFFWLTGALSSVLDNAPTYVVFFETANALTHEPGTGILPLTDGNFIRQDLLTGVSLGAVFFGAMTYIGNGPNFMVKSIAEQSGVKMPSFFGYMLYSCVVLLPLFVLITFLFLL